MSAELERRLRAALEELDSYLADQVAPLLATDAVETLLEFEPRLTADALHSWAATQYRLRGARDQLSDLIFHGLKKFQLFEEYQLVPAERFTAFLAALAGELISISPPGERERLEEMLRYLREGRTATIATVDRLHRAPTGGGAGAAAGPRAAAPAPTLSAEELRSLRRFSLMLERLSPAGGGKASIEAAPQLMVLAAAGAHSADELATRMEQLHQAGVAPAVARNLVHAVSAAIPDWVVRRGGSVEVVRGESVEAVRRVVNLAGDGARKSERWKDLLRSAAEHFNAGAFGRAVTLLDVADRMVKDRELDMQVTDIAKGNAHEAFDLTRLLQAAADPDNRPLLRRLAEFFPAWSVRELLDDLVYQPEKKRRRFILTMLEVWGAAAHKPVLDRLATALAEGSRDPNAWWYWRNLVFLLHRLPRSPEVDPRQELELAGQFSALGNHPSFQRETFVLLAQLPNGIGGPLLVQRLAEADRELEGAAPTSHELPEMWKILNSLAAALARTGTSAARRALVEHALAQRPRTGDSAARLRELAAVDLSGDREVVSRLLEALRTLQPVKVLGFLVSRNEEALTHVVRALASTSEGEVRRALAVLAEKFPDREYGRVAASGPVEAASPEPAPEDGEEVVVPPPPRRPVPRASLAGDLEVFGLPGLLQSLEQSEASGRLVLRSQSGRERASLELFAGRLAECRCGALVGDSAFYQVFEAPEPGTFEFVRGAEGAVARGKVRELMGLLMEAMRRFDEFQRLRALVPDHAFLRPGQAKPSAPEAEGDGELVRRVWRVLRGGASVEQCEAAAEVDSFRARSLLAHWLDEGALALEAAPSESALPPFGPDAAG